MGADYYESDSKKAKKLAAGEVPLGVGENCVITNAIIDKNAAIGKVSTGGSGDSDGSVLRILDAYTPWQMFRTRWSGWLVLCSCLRCGLSSHGSVILFVSKTSKLSTGPSSGSAMSGI